MLRKLSRKNISIAELKIKNGDQTDSIKLICLSPKTKDLERFFFFKINNFVIIFLFAKTTNIIYDLGEKLLTLYLT